MVFFGPLPGKRSKTKTFHRHRVYALRYSPKSCGSGCMIHGVYLYGYERGATGVGFGPWFAGDYTPRQLKIFPRGYGDGDGY